MKKLEEVAERTGHSTTVQAANIAKEARVNKLLIGHYSQRYKKLDDLLCFVEIHLCYYRISNVSTVSSWTHVIGMLAGKIQRRSVLCAYKHRCVVLESEWGRMQRCH